MTNTATSHTLRALAVGATVGAAAGIVGTVLAKSASDWVFASLDEAYTGPWDLEDFGEDDVWDGSD